MPPDRVRADRFAREGSDFSCDEDPNFRESLDWVVALSYGSPMTPASSDKVAAIAADILQSNTGETILEITPFRGYVWRGGKAFYRAETRGGSYFVKVRRNPPSDRGGLFEMLANLPQPCYRVPPLIGCQKNIEIWKYQSGDGKSLASYSQGELERLVEAVATTDATAKPPTELPKTFWLKRTSGELRLRAKTDPEFARYLPQIRRFGALEHRIFRSFKYTHITHNDLHSSNVIMTAKRVYLVDWDSVSLGPPGASLRAMSNWEATKRNWIAARYSAYAEAAGLKIEPEAVLYAMLSHQIYWALRTALRLNRLDRLPGAFRGLRRLTREFGHIVEPGK